MKLYGGAIAKGALISGWQSAGVLGVSLGTTATAGAVPIVVYCGYKAYEYLYSDVKKE
jgi:hypothetical protein